MITMNIKKNIPNILTIFRILLVTGLIVCLENATMTENARYMLIIGLSIFIVASITDALDGHLARKWEAETTFGRIFDPLADKLLILGTLIELSGPQFQISIPSLESDIYTTIHLGGIQPWMVIVIFFREIFVTSVRALAESQGIKFGANVSGKLKMFGQSIIIPLIILTIILLLPNEISSTNDIKSSPDVFKQIFVTLIFIKNLNYAFGIILVIITSISVIPYINKISLVLKGSPQK